MAVRLFYLLSEVSFHGRYKIYELAESPLCCLLVLSKVLHNLPNFTICLLQFLTFALKFSPSQTPQDMVTLAKIGQL